jgi:polysaccharide export outer membrane protein
MVTTGLVAGSATHAVAQTCQPAPPPEVLLGTGDNGNGGGAGKPMISPETAGTRASFIVEHPPDYVIGADDVLTINFWRDAEMSNDVVVRPDGKISLPLVNDIQAAGLTPMQLCEAVTVAAKQYLEAPTVSIVVKQINSRRVYIIGQVGKTGPYPMSASMTVVELIALAGGVAEFADKKNILVVRKEAGKDISYKVNYEEISKGRNLGQNIELRPGDIVIVR